MTPRARTDTSGFRRIFSVSVSASMLLKKLKRRTLYGQLLAQYRVPTQRLYTMALSPSSVCTVAATGQTCSHGAISQCAQATGWAATSGFSESPWK